MSAPYSDGRGCVIRADMVEALEAYVNEGLPLGSFLQAVVENDLKGAVARADGYNRLNLPAFATYVYMEMPSASQGSAAKYDAWLEMHAERRRARERT